ncbi:MAG: carboxypeptidase-like regulatory domain-containing protein [Bacteroidetes bacterium]|nr:carboxypeptidase-like regulatory domain-containing protein [Bacteroidota bacterium]
MKRILLLLILLFNSWCALSQNIKGVVLNNKTKKPVQECLVIIKGTTQTSITNEKGVFEFVNIANPKQETIVLTMLGYTTIEYKLNSYKKDTFYITQKDVLLKEVVISANKKNILNPKNDESILDFELLNDGFVILTAGTPKNNLRLMDEEGKVITSLKVNGKAETLKLDCIGNLQLLSNDSAWQVFYDYKNLNTLNPHTRKHFEEVLGNCVCMNNNCYYFQTKAYRNLRTNYFYYTENEKGIRHELAVLEDTDKIKSFELDYNLQYFLDARRKSNYTMYNEPVDTILRKMEQYRTELPLDWSYNNWLGEVKTQMMKIDTNTFIFHFTDTAIYDVTKNNELKFKSQLSAFKQKNVLPKTYIDSDYKEIYLTKFEESTLTIIKFNINTGMEISRTTISNTPFLPKKIIIKNGNAYFIQKNLADEQSYKIIKYYLNE